MHKFLRAIGFSDITKKDLEMILDEVITRPEIMKITKDSEGNEFAELSGSFAANAGITVRGTYQEDDSFHMDYYYPYVFGTSITTNEQIDVEKHAEKESYAGVCDEVNLGVTLIFYIQNVADYLAETNRHLSKIHYGAMLAGLSTEGKILCPVVERKKNDVPAIQKNDRHNQLIAQAREGDEDAIESLTLEDMDTYALLGNKSIFFAVYFHRSGHIYVHYRYDCKHEARQNCRKCFTNSSTPIYSSQHKEQRQKL